MASLSGWLPRRLAAPAVLLVLWSSAVAQVGAQQPASNAGPDPVKNFCMRWWSQSVVKHNVLYIDSGVERFNDSGDVYLGINNHILTINLTETWDWKIPANESGGLSIDVRRKNVTESMTGTPVPNLIRGHMFQGPDNVTEVFNFGGTTYMNNRSFVGYVRPDSSQYPLWTYDASKNGFWNQHTIGQTWLPNHGAAAEDVEKGLGFYLGGQIDFGTSTKTQKFNDITQNLYMPLDGMLILNLVNLDGTAANITTSTMNRSTPRVGGTLEYIAAVGDSGILVALGGQIQPGLKFGQIANRTKGELIDFNTVDIFDLESYFQDPSSSNGTWYQQNTTGAIPPPRIDFCTVSASAPDNSSHHIYLYGGIDPINNKYYDDVVVLSIPSFTWTNVWPVGESPRLGHGCHRAGKRQMVTVGGNVTNLSCDWEKKGVAFLDLSTAKWGSKFNADQADYEVPPHVFNVTGGTGKGNATVREPKQGWTEKGLGEVFRKSRYTLPPSWHYPVTKKKPGGSKKNIGAIVGGVVGGVAGLAIIAAILYILHRRRVKAPPSELHSDDIPRPHEEQRKEKYELQGVNENDPAELPGPDAVELNAPREFAEADHDTATWMSELPGTNVVAGGVHGVPIVRTPGDDLPEMPEYTPGLRRLASTGSSRRSSSRRRRRSSTASNTARETQAIPTEPSQEADKDHISTSADGPSSDVQTSSREVVLHTSQEAHVSPPESVSPATEHATSTTQDEPVSPPEPIAPSTSMKTSEPLPGTAL